MSELSNILIFGGLAGLATITGILLILFFRKWAEKNSILLISFAAGVLMASAFNNLIPESISLYKNGLLIVLVGFLIFYLIEHFFLFHPCEDEECRVHATGKIAALGLGVHSLIDGLAIGIGFEVSFKIGLIAFIGVLMHEFPEGTTTMSILLHSKIKKSTAIFYAVLVAIATPVGAIASYFVFKNINQSFLGIALAIAAGSFIYVAASELIPEIHRRFNKVNALVVLLGVVFLILINKLL
ncbi:ZIP family metal transporter [Candidatus Pacearchaeota archaeon]|nr:ZIP family metal transporter [Candidatus Pacearchaeota archaeon]